MLVVRAAFCVLLVVMTTTHVSCLEDPLSLEIMDVLERVEAKLDNLQSRVSNLEAQQKQNNQGIAIKLDTLHSKVDDMSQIISVSIVNTTTPEPCRCYPCRNGECIDASLKCNGENDCGDYSDESNCIEDKTTTAEPCSSFKCDNGECIHESLKCDGENDCGDNSDESHCIPSCPSGFTMVGLHECLLYVDPGHGSRRTWLESKGECEQRGVRLAHLEDSDMSLVQGYLITMSGGSYNNPWVGARQYGPSGRYQWTATKTAITNWKYEEPDTVRRGNCVLLDISHSKHMEDQCSATATFLCEAPVIWG